MRHEVKFEPFETSIPSTVAEVESQLARLGACPHRRYVIKKLGITLASGSIGDKEPLPPGAVETARVRQGQVVGQYNGDYSIFNDPDEYHRFVAVHTHKPYAFIVPGCRPMVRGVSVEFKPPNKLSKRQQTELKQLGSTRRGRVALQRLPAGGRPLPGKSKG